MDVNIIAPIHTQIVPFNTMRIIVCINILNMKKFWRAVDQAKHLTCQWITYYIPQPSMFLYEIGRCWIKHSMTAFTDCWITH